MPPDLPIVYPSSNPSLTRNGESPVGRPTTRPDSRGGTEECQGKRRRTPQVRGRDMGGAEGTRTPDPLLAKQVRYQLRHSPGWCVLGLSLGRGSPLPTVRRRPCASATTEPLPAPPRQRQRAEPRASSPDPRRAVEWAWMDLNHRPLPYQGSALTELSYRPVPRHVRRRRARRGYPSALVFPWGQFRSASVTSMPPTRSVQTL